MRSAPVEVSRSSCLDQGRAPSGWRGSHSEHCDAATAVKPGLAPWPRGARKAWSAHPSVGLFAMRPRWKSRQNRASWHPLRAVTISDGASVPFDIFIRIFRGLPMPRKSPDAVINLRLSGNLLSTLDRATKALETSRSEYVRRAVREALIRDEPLTKRFA
jgi:hypothetical protein